ncbi:MAG: protein kinase [Proteobacteria bacterium]|nr:protein kinase [Cystobacterineae bacterium]MCL2259455.1 protein kinase [Cystobacterineae bacterium]MCL2314103.1 protein kinase [Pseudomonadota bacterium]
MKKSLVLGRYHLLDRVNIGGMAEVFIAKTFGVGGFEQILAVKRILPTMAEDEDFVKMFIHEAHISAKLNHPNIVRIHGLESKDGSYYIVMDYVSGRDLRSVLERFRRRKESMPIPMAAYIASKICEGLDYAHRKKDARGQDFNIVHRDVSPQNILLSYEGEVKLIDFGIAKTTIRPGVTEAGVIKGKFGYMSPEQAYGTKSVDRRSDIFAAAVILYEMLTGEKLFAAESDFSTLEKVRHARIRPPRQINDNIPPALEEILLRALAQDVEARYQWASDFHEALEKFTFGESSKFLPKDLSAILKDKFAEEYINENNRLKHYDEFMPQVLPVGEAPFVRKGNEPFRTSTFQTSPGQRKSPYAFVAEKTEVIVLEDGVPQPPVDMVGYPPTSEASSERLGPVSLTNFPPYTGVTMVGGQTGEGVGVVENTTPLVQVKEGRAPFFELFARWFSQANLWFWPWFSRTWVWSSSSAAGVVVLGLVLWALLGASPVNGRFVVVQDPAGIPVEVILKNPIDGYEQRVVVKDEFIVLPPGLYQLEVNSADKKYRAQTENVGLVEILKREDFFVSVQLDTIREEGQPQEGGALGTSTAPTESGANNEPSPPSENNRLPNPAGLQLAAVEPHLAASPLPPDDQPLQPATAKETFVLMLGDLPLGTKVSVGNKSLVTTSKLKQMVLPMQGSHKVSLSKSGYRPVTETLHNADKKQVLHLNVVMRPSTAPSTTSATASALPPSPPIKYGKLAVSTSPTGAEIWVNGKKTADRTPRTLSNPILLPEGKHTLRFKLGAKQSKEVSVRIMAEHATNPHILSGVPLE